MPSPKNPFGPVVGGILACFPCEYKSNRGNLFVATEGLCFHSTFLAFETSRLVIPWRSVKNIISNEEDKIDLVVKHNGGENHQLRRGYTFRVLNGDSGTARDIVIRDVREAHLKNGGAIDPDGLSTVHEEDLDRGGNQLCNQVSGVSTESDLKEADVDQPNHLPHAKKHLVQRSQSEPLRKRKIQTGKNASKYESEADFLADCTISAMAGFQPVSEVIKAKKEAIALKGDEEKMEEPPSTSSMSNNRVSNPPKDMLQAWKDARDKKDPSFKEVACKGIHLPCSVKAFFDIFLSDSASHSMASFQSAEKGDTDFDTSNWDLSDDSFAMERTMNYIHPVSAPMAPPTAQARKRQTLRRFGEYGLCMETKTMIEDIPMSDYFYVEDRILVEPLLEGGVSLTALFEMRFVKNTMLRKIIENTTKQEYLKYWKGFADMAKRALATSGASKEGQEQKAVPIVIPEVVVEQPRIEAWLLW
eukprot:CAMPEP_0113533156 /NCGR_PEP_ID=MMETSP0015_2-20120614/4447_1 /TAXON_ID=2838 /ORGANISM="Odontella" /LENGTH=472 /DNA_ID=CAMNT_0000432175 /DNA_START=432 /DNA_END=1847 /DNA_ORIENTATION=- /assembly_acc=CAM_ASM_000160